MPTPSSIPDPWIPPDPNTGEWVAIPVAVFRNPNPDGSGTWTALPNVFCRHVHRRMGTDPGSASLQYLWDTGLDGAPNSLEEALSTGADSPLVIGSGDRIAVIATAVYGTQASRGENSQPIGTQRTPAGPGAGAGDGPQGVVIFEGFATKFGLGIDDADEEANVLCTGVAIRLWDKPIPGAFMRQSDSLTDASKNIQTDVVAHFNPKGIANAIPFAGWATGMDAGMTKLPVFVDPLVGQQVAGAAETWKLNGAGRYLLYQHNAGQEYVSNPTGAAIDAALVAREPISGTALDEADPASYTASPITVPDKPITGKTWPEVLHDLIAERNIGMWYEEINPPPTSPPYSRLRMQGQQAGPIKQIWLQPRGDGLDLTQTNVAAADLERDVSEVVNSWTVMGAQKRFEASFVLAPGFPMAAADATDGNSIGAYDKNNPSFQNNTDKYRLYNLDEAGVGHYAIGSGTPSTGVSPDLSGVFGVADQTKYAARYRRPIGTLLTADPDGVPTHHRLDISTDYAGAWPGPWDGTGTWQRVSGGYRLLRDQVGIYITANNPNDWHIGESRVGGAPFPSGSVKGVELMAQAAAGKNIYLMLTCVVEGDACISATQDRQDVSPIPQTVARQIDARDRYHYDVVCKKSMNNRTATDNVVRDDTDACKAEAVAATAATQAGVLGGKVRIPYFTDYYRRGDRISALNGRGLGLNTSGGSPTSYAPIYPVIIEVEHRFGQESQETILTLSDSGQDRRGKNRIIHRKRAKQ